MSDCIIHSVDVDVGVLPEESRKYRSFKVHFHRFSSLDSTKGRRVISPVFHAFNHDWILALYPGGKDEANDGMVSIKLSHFSMNEITVQCDILIKNKSGELIGRLAEEECTFGHSGRSWKNAIKRSFLNVVVNNGTLTMEIQMKVAETKSRVNFMPKNQFGKCMLKLFLDEESADVVFELKSDDTSSKIHYHAHRCVLKACAPDLFRLCEDCDVSTARSL